jgi:3-hydroxybutyryl-CoA dehydrogenase
MSTICICGAGTMGSGIAQVSAMAGFQTIVFDLNQDVVQKAKEKISADLQKLTDKKKITEEKMQEVLSQLYFTSDIHMCIADVVIEAIVEKPEAKISLFTKLAEINSMQTIFASNTSSLPITALAKEIVAPQRVAGLHFFNPAPVMKLVEVVRAEQTSDEVTDMLIEFTKRLGKIPVVCTDSPGFIVNRVARPFYIESLRLAEEGISFEIIDRLLENRGFKMGPFKLMDLIGNDVNYAVSCSVYEQLNQPERLKPSYIQKDKVSKGELGKKSGKGYFEYNKV